MCLYVGAYYNRCLEINPDYTSALDHKHNILAKVAQMNGRFMTKKTNRKKHILKGFLKKINDNRKEYRW